MGIKQHAAYALVKRFIDVDPQQAALALEGLPEAEAALLLTGLPLSAAASCLDHARPDFSAGVVAKLSPASAAPILAHMEPDHAADIIRALTEPARHEVLAVLTPELSRRVCEMLTYPEGSAGRLMKTSVLSFHEDLTVREVIARLRAKSVKRAHSYAYVVGTEHKLLGVLNMRDLIMAAPDERLGAIRREVFSVPAFTAREELVHFARERNYLYVPVVDAHGRLLGAVRAKDILESSESQATKDIQMMFGAGGEERALSPVRLKISRRLPWLHVNLATAFLAAGVVSLFQDLIARLAVLAVFLHIVCGQGGNAGVQSLSVVLRGLVMHEVRPRDAARLIWGEVAAALFNGLVVGVVTAVVAWLWRGNPFLGVVVGAAMLVNMTAAGLAGAGIPVLMKRLGFDPAQSSGIFLTTVTDIVGIAAFLGLAALCEPLLH
ncbi:MAG: magnesium transporter [Elusimicrobia bacterium]|nr:magnesium transporter [Elusimicrobiota bacterium]